MYTFDASTPKKPLSRIDAYSVVQRPEYKLRVSTGHYPGPAGVASRLHQTESTAALVSRSAKEAIDKHTGSRRKAKNFPTVIDEAKVDRQSLPPILHAMSALANVVSNSTYASCIPISRDMLDSQLNHLPVGFCTSEKEEARSNIINY